MIAPTGEIVAQASTQEDEVITYQCDLEKTKEIQNHIFNFKYHRQSQHYAAITD
ncbi:MAG: hypothetical protein R3261_06260 [Alphaproteobacteria bacterium]|nr:hypothetical protein [Alphaproteobacteria bacterium]